MRKLLGNFLSISGLQGKSDGEANTEGDVGLTSGMLATSAGIIFIIIDIIAAYIIRKRKLKQKRNSMDIELMLMRQGNPIYKPPNVSL